MKIINQIISFAFHNFFFVRKQELDYNENKKETESWTSKLKSFNRNAKRLGIARQQLHSSPMVKFLLPSESIKNVIIQNSRADEGMNYHKTKILTSCKRKLSFLFVTEYCFMEKPTPFASQLAIQK